MTLARGHRRLAVAAGAAVATATALTAAGSSVAWASGGSTWYVNAASGSDSTSCGTSTATACKTISQAVTNASSGDTIQVAPGRYAEQVVVRKQLDIEGAGAGSSSTDRSIVAPPASVYNGFRLNRDAAGSTIRGFWITGAQGEGILAVRSSGLTIENNVVANNDRGAFNPNTRDPQCKAQGEIPGDCGEGVHLLSTTQSSIQNNVVTNNSGGILLTDELGPVFGNKILRNVVFDNAFDCGITVAGHNSHAAPGGTPAPKVGGIYLNLISHNISNSNGLKGGGAGILLAGGGPGTAVYKNLVVDNSAYNNGLAGLTLHDHAPGQFMDGNRIIGNSFDNNGSEGDSDAGITQTADVVIFSAVDIVHGTVVSHNHLSNAHYGIWTKNAPTTVNGNVFTAVAVPVTQS